MAKIDLKKFIDNSLKAEFEAKPYSIDKDRSKLVKRLQGALTQFPASKAPNKIWKLTNGIVKVKVPVGSGLLTIEGATTNYVPESQFANFINALVEATNAGEFDGALKAVQTAPQASTGGEKQKRNVSEASRLNIRVGGFRRGGKSDAEIRKLLTDEGVDKAAIDAAISYKAPKKK